MDISDTNGLMKLKEFLQWRREQPEEYKQFLADLKEFYKELKEVLDELY